ncbi:hypothetical protein GSU3587 [Geobacter sulfurreducens PCA]|uniref:Uncharacterized protein n=1 Tax=Geobacter sulfurreducens (strain ATCC 51573 / DSM 12127 / PCA) TaxID=243231 RepID=I7EF39_GEOSL|nr:hypothetical protein GSU3587 [Geobacter sulfurreducens PCA]HCD94850.1 hypothetical protein [Geobacter sulfurreducens]
MERENAGAARRAGSRAAAGAGTAEQGGRPVHRDARHALARGSTGAARGATLAFLRRKSAGLRRQPSRGGNNGVPGGVHPVWWWGEYDGGFVRGCYTFQGLAGGVATVNYAGCQTYISEFECINLGMLVSSCPQIKFRLSLFHLSFPTGRSLKKCIM